MISMITKTKAQRHGSYVSAFKHARPSRIRSLLPIFQHGMARRQSAVHRWLDPAALSSILAIPLALRTEPSPQHRISGKLRP